MLLNLQTSVKAKIDYGLQRIIKFVNKTHQRELLLTKIVIRTSTTFDCFKNDVINIKATKYKPTAHALKNGKKIDKKTKNYYSLIFRN